MEDCHDDINLENHLHQSKVPWVSIFIFSELCNRKKYELGCYTVSKRRCATDTHR